MEEFKKLQELIEPDERNFHFGITDMYTCETKPLSVEDIYRWVSEIKLSETVPDEIKSQFNVAKNLAVYSWFSYSFHQVSEMKAYSTLEHALKFRLGKHKYGFKGLIKKAVQLGLVKDSGFMHIPGPESEDSIEYSKKLPILLPHFRNELAHGSTMLHPGSVLNLQICASFINQLFKNELNKQRNTDSGADEPTPVR